MIEVLKQMVEALEWCHGGEPIGTAEAIKAGKQAIAELESQEPVAWRFKTGTWWNREVHWRYVLSLDGTEGLLGLEPLYTHPPQRTWVGLTDEEKYQICNSHYNRDSELVEMVEAKLKDKNT